MPAALAIPAAIGGIGSIVGGVLSSNAAGTAAGIQQRNAQLVAGMAGQAAQGAQAGEGASVGIANSQLIQQLLSGQGFIQQGVNNAGNLITSNTNQANATLADIFNQEGQNLNPYLQAGQQGITALQAALAPGGSLAGTFTAPTAADVQNTPGYQFTLDQGTQAIMRNAAASGLTGGTLKNITQYGQGLAGNYYQQAYNNALQAYNTNRNANLQNIQQLLGLGQYGTSAFDAAAQNYGNAASTNLMNSGLTQAQINANAGSLLGNLTDQSGQALSNNTLRASEYGGNVGLQAAQIAGSALTQGANAQAAGTIGQANAWNSAIGGLTNSAQLIGLGSLLQTPQSAAPPAPTIPFTYPGSSNPPTLATPQFTPNPNVMNLGIPQAPVPPPAATPAMTPAALYPEYMNSGYLNYSGGY